MNPIQFGRMLIKRLESCRAVVFENHLMLYCESLFEIRLGCASIFTGKTESFDIDFDTVTLFVEPSQSWAGARLPVAIEKVAFRSETYHMSSEMMLRCQVLQIAS